MEELIDETKHIYNYPFWSPCNFGMVRGGPEPVSVKLIASQSALMTALSWWRAFFREMLTKISRWAWPAKRTHLYP